MSNEEFEYFEALRERDDAYDRLVSDGPDERALTMTEEIFGSEQAFWRYKEG